MARGVTLITGASAGLGVEFARACAARGEALALAARRRERMEALAGELGGEAHVFAIDLAEPEAAVSLLNEIEAEGLQVDVLINNAGFGGGGRFAEISFERQRDMVRLNVGTLTELARLVLPGMLERGRGAILNVASTAAFQPGPNMAVYYASKAYVLSFTEALHEELKGKGVRVSALCPGPTDTEFFEAAGYRRQPPKRISADARSRESQASFACVDCGFRANADTNAAIVILRRSTAPMPVEGRGCAPDEAGTGLLAA